MKYVILIIGVSIVIHIIYTLYSNYHSVNNVCKSSRDYYTNRDQNENCYKNLDTDLTAPEIIKRHNYPLETHTVTTTDGYILTLFRIPNNQTLQKKVNPVLLQHGFASNSASFLGKGRNSLAFMLSNAGYDVWIANFRGTVYSRTHIHLNSSDSKYWEFSFHENGVYDVPASLDLIASVTNQKIICIGYSLGAATNYVYSSIYPELASKRAEIFISMAPAAFLVNIGYPMRFALTLMYHGYAKDLVPFDKVTSSERFFRTVCLPYPFQMELCYWAVYLSSGYYYEQVDYETLPILFLQMFDSFSSKAFAHFSQLFILGKTSQFHYDAETNLKYYGSEESPLYNFSKVLVPSYMIRTEHDTLITKEGVDKLHSQLPKAYNKYDVHIVDIPHFSHSDFLYGKDAQKIYTHILEFLENEVDRKLLYLSK